MSASTGQDGRLLVDTEMAAYSLGIKPASLPQPQPERRRDAGADRQHTLTQQQTNRGVQVAVTEEVELQNFTGR